MYVFIILGVIILIKTIWFFKEKNKDKHQTFSTYLQNIGVLIAIAFLIDGYRSSSESYENASKQLENLQKQNTLLKESIDSSSKASSNVLDYLRSISGSSQDLSSTFHDVSGQLRSLPKEISSIESNLTSINEMTQRQKELAENELLRVPKIEIVDSCSKSGFKFYIMNMGNVTANLDRVQIYIEGNYSWAEIILDYEIHWIQLYNPVMEDGFEVFSVDDLGQLLIKAKRIFTLSLIPWDADKSKPLKVKLELYYTFQNNKSNTELHETYTCY